MRSYTIAVGIIKAILFFIGLALVLFVLFRIRILIIYMVAAFVLALLGRPLVRFLKRKLHITKNYGAIITLILIFGLMVGLIGMFVPVLTEQGKNLALFNFDSIEAELDTVYGKISGYIGTSRDTVENLVKESEIEKSATEELDNAAPTLLETVLGVFTQLSVGLFSIFFMAFFMLKEHNSLQLFIVANGARKAP